MGEPAITTEQAIVGRDDKGRMLPGHSGNPNGRPKDLEGVRRQVREQGPTLIKRLLEIATGTLTRRCYTPLGDPYEQPPSFKDQTAASAVLLSYWLGKPSQSIEISTADDGADFLRITLERMRRDPVSSQAMLVIAESSAKGE